MQSIEVSTSLNVDEVFTALETWIKQRPGLDINDYVSPGTYNTSYYWQGISAYRSELRSIAKDRKRALSALDEARNLSPHKSELLADAFHRAYSGRLQWITYRTYECWGCKHEWDQKVELSTSTQRLSGEKSAFCPKCGKKFSMGSQYKGKLEYCTGQYWPTEYRKAAAAVLETYVSSWRQAYAHEHPTTFEYRTMDDVIAANRQVGGHWFDRGAMGFFNCKIESGAVAIHDDVGRPTRARFITSEKGPDEVRRYSIREAQPDGTIDTVGEFQQYRTRDAARAALLRER